MKECITCKKGKPFTEFYKRKGAKDGYQYSCRSCQRSRQRTNAIPVEDLTEEQRKLVWARAILNMHNNGIASTRTTKEMLERVGSYAG